MSFGEAIKHNFSHYADFNGRAQRSQFWWWWLFVVVVSVVMNGLDSLFGLRVGESTTDFTVNGQVIPIVNQGYGVLSTIFALAVLLPTLAVTARRMHDAMHSAWWILWCFLLGPVCFVGVIIYYVFMLQKGTPGPNKYGPDPLGAA